MENKIAADVVARAEEAKLQAQSVRDAKAARENVSKENFLLSQLFFANLFLCHLVGESIERIGI